MVDFRIDEANGTAERDQALVMLVDNNPQAGQLTVGGDKVYDTKEFVEQCRHCGITAHVAQNTCRHKAADFLGFMKLVARQNQRRELHVVLESCGAPLR